MGQCHSKKIEKPIGVSKKNISADDSVNIESRDMLGGGGLPRKLNNKGEPEVKEKVGLDREVTQEVRNAFLDACYRGDSNKLEEIIAQVPKLGMEIGSL